MRAGLWAVVALVALAGCGGFGTPGATPSVTETPAPVPTADPSEVTVAPGVTGAGVVAPAALAGSHERYLANRSYALAVNRTVRYANGTLRSQVVTRVRLARNRTYHTDIRVAGPHATLVIGESPASAAFWSNGSIYLRKYTRGNETVYNAFEPVGGAGTWTFWVHFFVLEGSASADIEALFDAVETRAVDRTTVDGHRQVRVASVGTHRSTAFVDVDETRNVRDVEVRATVDERGFVRRYRVRYAATVDGDPVRVVRTVEYAGIGETTVARPSWYDDAVGEA